jgi:protein-tyrosine phosphatase
MHRHYDYNLIHGTLYQGAVPPLGGFLHERLGMQVLVLAAEENQPPEEAFEGLREVLHAPNVDGELTPERVAVAETAAIRVAHHLRRGRNVLVSCHMGLNRSGLISALALVKATGMSGRDAMKIVQSQRRMALVNPWFVRYLVSIPASVPVLTPSTMRPPPPDPRSPPSGIR